MVRQIPLMSHNTCCSFPRAENHFLIFSRFTLRPSLSKAAARAELVLADPDFPQPVYQLPDIIQLGFPFFPRSSVFPDWPSCIQGDKLHQLQAPQSPPEMDSLPSPIHAFSALSICTFHHVHPISSFLGFFSHPVQFCTCFSAQGINCQHLVHILNWENNHEIWFFKREFGNIPLGWKRQTGVYGQEKKKENGGDHKLWKLHASSKDENNQVSRLVFTWAAGQLQKKCTIMAKLPQSRGSL